MNERIKKIVFDAIDFRLDPDSKCYEAQVHPEDLEYLAELIVRECAQVSEDDISDGDACCTNTADRIARQIKKHFGVEE